MEGEAKIGDVVRIIGGCPGRRYTILHVAHNPVIGGDLLTVQRDDSRGPVIFVPFEQTKPAESIAFNVAPLCR